LKTTLLIHCPDQSGIISAVTGFIHSKGGNIIIPAFAVDRTEVVLLLIKKLVEKKRIPSLPVFVDSPMALKTLEVYREAIREGRPDIRADLNGMNSPFDPGNLIEAKTVDESKAIRNQSFPSIIISASGMATGGRILHHLAHYLPDHRNSVIMVGFQAAGTRGRSLVEGVTSLKLLGRDVQVRASVVEVDAFSVHADSKEILDWLSKAKKAPEMTYVVHGEETAALELSRKIEKQLSWPAVVPHLMERVRLD
jgi:metallo-beta-lactamase family protein